jgi:hypothetical protein
MFEVMTFKFCASVASLLAGSNHLALLAGSNHLALLAGSNHLARKL